MLVDRFLRDSAQRTAGAIALIEPSRSTTYGELNLLANRFANAFVAGGVRRGDRVVIGIENSVEFVAAYFGTLRAGAVAVPLRAGPREDRFPKAILDCRPAACVIDASTLAEAGQALQAVSCLLVKSSPARFDANKLQAVSLDEALSSVTDEAPSIRAIDQDLAAIIYTSGSTGDPRGVMLTHRNIVANTRSILEYLHLTSADRVMCVLPFYYVYGLSLLHTHVAAGGSLVIDNRFAYPSIVLRAMREHAVTGFAGVPSTFTLLLSRPELAETDLPSLRYITQAGGAMAPSRIREWRERMPRASFYVMYGATEASARLTYLEPAALDRKLGSIGRPIPNVDIQVLREDGTRADVGEVGELVARGANISSGYWNEPEETRARFGPRGYHTGDLGYVDEDGFLFLVGRRHDMIKTGAHRVGAKEIEDVLYQHPAVQEAAVIGAPHDLLGEVPIAFVSLRTPDAAEPEGLRVFCATRLPTHKVPGQVFIRTELPKIAGIGKIDKRALRDTVGAVAAK